LHSESLYRVSSVGHIEKDGFVMRLRPTELVDGGWADVGGEPEEVIESSGLDRLPFRRCWIASPSQIRRIVGRRLVRYASHQRVFLAEVVVNTISVVLDIERLHAVVDVVLKPACQIVLQRPET